MAHSSFTNVAANKQPAELRCFSCGAFVGHDRPLVRTTISALRLEKAAEMKCAPEYVAMVPGTAPEVGDLLDSLGHNRMCCRTILISEWPHLGIQEPPLEKLVLPK